MLRQPHQRSIYNDIDESKSSARNRCVSSNQYDLNQSKSIKKQCSNKYLRPFSPKKYINYQSTSNKKIIPDFQSSHQNLQRENQMGFIEQKNCLSSHRALKTIDYNLNTDRQNFDPNKKIHLSSQKPKKNNQPLIQKFHSNETKIILMRQQLEKIFETFKQREKEIQQKKSELKNKEKIKAQNQFLSKQIARVQQMIKQALLERQKLKHSPLSKRVKR